MKGQSEEQQATDRYQCHQWAADQTGFDPTQPGVTVPEPQRALKRAEYQRAMKALSRGARLQRAIDRVLSFRSPAFRQFGS